MTTSPPPFEQFVTFLPVADLERSSKFYGEVLGLPLALDQGRCRVYRVEGTDRGFVGVCQREDAQALTGLFVTLVSHDVDAWYEHLVAQGVEVEKTPQLHPGFNVYHLFVRDPDGHLIEIQRFESPDWPRVDGSGD